MNLKEAQQIWGDHGKYCYCADGQTDGEHMKAKGFLEGVASRDTLIKELVEALEVLKARKSDNPVSAEAALDGSNVGDAFKAGMDTESFFVAETANAALTKYYESLKDEVIKPKENKE